MAPSFRLFIVAAAVLCCVAQAAAASKLPSECSHAASAVCQGESANALACLKAKALAGSIEIPMACATALKALPQARTANLHRLLTEQLQVDCDNPNNGLTCASSSSCPVPTNCCCNDSNNGGFWVAPTECCA